MEQPPEILITRVLHQRMREEDCFQPGDRESVAYRVSEIMVTAKQLYTEMLPRLLQPDPEAGLSLYEELAGLRMAFLHIRDLVTDFDEAFFEAMHHQREEEGTPPLLPPTDDADEAEPPAPSGNGQAY